MSDRYGTEMNDAGNQNGNWCISEWRTVMRRTEKSDC